MQKNNIPCVVFSQSTANLFAKAFTTFPFPCKTVIRKKFSHSPSELHGKTAFFIKSGPFFTLANKKAQKKILFSQSPIDFLSLSC